MMRSCAGVAGLPVATEPISFIMLGMQVR